MAGLIADKATICVVNYKTLELTKCCLRSIRKFTKYPYEVIVVDNASKDESLDYLKTINWIRLIERSTENDPNGGYSHAIALDRGLANCKTEFFISMHSDTIVLREDWLADLVNYFKNDNNISCVGSGKIELKPKWQVAIQKATDLRTFKRKFLKEPDMTRKHRYYNRTICCLYRTDILHREKFSFLMDREKGMTSGQKLYFELIERGYKTVELPPVEMRRYIIHIAHATQVINRREFALRKKTIRKCNRLINKIMSSAPIQAILADDSLDE